MTIKEIDLFEGISPEAMKEISACFVEQTFPKDRMLFTQDENANCLFILKEGRVDLIVKNGGYLVYSLSEPGEVFGWSCLVESGKYTASGRCGTDLKVVKIEKEKLDKIFEKYPDVGIRVLRRIGRVVTNRLMRAYKDLMTFNG